MRKFMLMLAVVLAVTMVMSCTEAGKGEGGDKAFYTRWWGEIVDDIDSIGDGGFRFSDPGLGSGAVVSTGFFVVGVHGGLPFDVQMDLLGLLVDSLAPASM